MPHMFPALIAKGISQEFHPSKPVLSNVDLTVHPGQIHAVVGQSGAGKSVLADILGGVARPTSGTMHLQGQLTVLRNELEAVGKTVRYVKQFWDRHSRMTVADALQLEAIPRKFGLVDSHALNERARGQLSMFGLNEVDPKSKVCELSAGKQKLLQIAAILSKPTTLLVLDDPAAALNAAETDVLYEKLSQLQYASTGVVYLTQRAEEALEVGDQISVLRDGRLIATHDPESVFAPQITGEMIGVDTSREPIRPPRAAWPEVALRVEGVSVEHCVYGLSIKVRRGEVLGLFGLQYAGQSETVRAIGGLEPRTDGEIFLKASGQPSRIKTPEEAFVNGLGLITEPYGRQPGVVDSDPSSLAGRPLRGLNAENPQKSAIAKCLKSGCSSLLFDNPTRGLNVACRLELYRAIQDIADLGTSVVAASTNVDELVQVSDRIAVMVDGRIVKTFERSAFSAEKILAIAKSRK